MPDPATGTISVVVPVREDGKILSCIRSILREAGCLPAEVIVVAHRATPAFERVLAGLPAGVKVLYFDGETVYGARNAAVAAAAGEVIFFTDADCLVRPGWFAEALLHIRAGAHLVQGYSGTLGHSRVDLLLQHRYAAAYRARQPGDPMECDTRNLAVRHPVFDAVSFPGSWKRSGDTMLGLAAERAGFRVEHCPAMRIDHRHEPDLRLFVAKQVCHGWGAQRITEEMPGVRWHGSHLQIAARFRRWGGRIPARQSLGMALARAAVGGAPALQRALPLLPMPFAAGLLAILDKAGSLAGHLLYRPGDPEPALSAIMGRPLARD